MHRNTKINAKTASAELKSGKTVLIRAAGGSMYPFCTDNTVFLCTPDTSLFPGKLAVIYSNTLLIHRILYCGKKIAITWGDSILFPHIHKKSHIIGTAEIFRPKKIHKIPGFLLFPVLVILKLILKGVLVAKKTF